MIGSEGCVNVVTSNMVIKFGLNVVLYPQLYKVSWLNSASINVKERCLVSIQFATYSDEIWSGLVTMDVGHIILGKSWLHD